MMQFDNFRKKSVKIGKLKKNRMPSGKRRVHSVSGRHYDGMHHAFSGRHSKLFFYFRSLPSRPGYCRSACQQFFDVHYAPVTLISYQNVIDPLQHLHTFMADKVTTMHVYVHVYRQICNKYNVTDSFAQLYDSYMIMYL